MAGDSLRVGLPPWTSCRPNPQRIQGTVCIVGTGLRGCIPALRRLFKALLQTYCPLHSCNELRDQKAGLRNARILQGRFAPGTAGSWDTYRRCGCQPVIGRQAEVGGGCAFRQWGRDVTGLGINRCRERVPLALGHWGAWGQFALLAFR
jgi:hypothetical protein